MSQRIRDANRRDARRSTGPKTPSPGFWLFPPGSGINNIGFVPPIFDFTRIPAPPAPETGPGAGTLSWEHL